MSNNLTVTGCSVADALSASNASANSIWSGLSTSATINVDMSYVTDRINSIDSKIDNVTKKPEVREDTTTKFDIMSGNIYVNRYKNGFSVGRKLVMSDIKDVTVYHNTVIVTFADNTKTVAAMDPEDKFDLEQGISICITKKLLGDNGTSIYNKLIKRAFKVMNNNEAARIKADEEKAEKKRRDEAYIAKKKKIKAKKREAEIELRKEAIIRAMREMNEMN